MSLYQVRIPSPSLSLSQTQSQIQNYKIRWCGLVLPAVRKTVTPVLRGPTIQEFCYVSECAEGRACIVCCERRVVDCKGDIYISNSGSGKGYCHDRHTHVVSQFAN